MLVVGWRGKLGLLGMLRRQILHHSSQPADGVDPSTCVCVLTS